MASPRFASPNTPESILPRSDSKNPARTCRGVTANGRKCRRDVGLAAPAAAGDSMYCWQHKHQAVVSSGPPGAHSPARPPHRRNSDDTLLGRLGDLNLQENGNHRPQHKPEKPKVKRSTWGMLCCMTAHDDSDDERLEVVVRRRRPVQRPPPSAADTADERFTKTSSNTAALMKLIPSSTPPAATSALLAELSKPLAPNDEPGYIYIFILTDNALPQPRESDTASLLAPSTSVADGVARSMSVRGPSDKKQTLLLKIGRAVNVHRRMEQWQRQCGYNITLVRFYPYVSSQARSPTPGSPRASPSPKPRPGVRRTSTPGDMELTRGVRQVPYSHRVERLIHLELARYRAKLGPCDACGREHREWFSIEASRRGIGFVDTVVKRWVTWAEAQ